MKKNISLVNNLRETSTNILACNLYKKAYIFRRHKVKKRYGGVVTDLNFSHCFLRHDISTARYGFSIAFQTYNFHQGKGWNNVRACILINTLTYSYGTALRSLNKSIACLETINLQSSLQSKNFKLLVLNPILGGYKCLFNGLVGFLPWNSLPTVLAYNVLKKSTLWAALYGANYANPFLNGNCLVRTPFDQISVSVTLFPESPVYKTPINRLARLNKMGRRIYSWFEDYEEEVGGEMLMRDKEDNLDVEVDHSTLEFALYQKVYEEVYFDGDVGVGEIATKNICSMEDKKKHYQISDIAVDSVVSTLDPFKFGIEYEDVEVFVPSRLIFLFKKRNLNDNDIYNNYNYTDNVSNKNSTKIDIKLKKNDFYKKLSKVQTSILKTNLNI